MTVQEVAVISRNVKFEGITEDAKYTISGVANIYEGAMQSIDTGVVEYQGSTVATFSMYGEGSSNFSFNNMDTSVQRQEVMTAIDGFMEGVKDLVDNEANGTEGAGEE